MLRIVVFLSTAVEKADPVPFIFLTASSNIHDSF
jgi:hypothetical protein